MTIEDAKKNVTAYVYMECENIPKQVIKALDVLKDSAMECEQYRALGTVEELKEAREKQVAKKPNIVGEFFRLAECSDCHTVIQFKQEYCHKCGNKVDWEEGGTSEEA